MFLGDVARVDFGACVVLLDDGSLVRAGVRGRLMGPRKALGNAVVVGDRARCERMAVDPGDEPETGDRRERKVVDAEVVVVDVEPRRSVFSRRAVGRHPAEQVVAANIDQVVVVTSWAEPPFSPGFADRVLCQAEHSGLPVRLVVNKLDLAPTGAGGAEPVRAILHAYAMAGCPGHAVCARSGIGLDELRTACRGRRSLFIGHSGVGKSTLLNALVPGLDFLAGQVNDKTGKGRHTTTAAWLVRPEPGLELIDTPGVRAFGLWGIDAGGLDRTYHEFKDHREHCRFRDCSHVREPDCGVRAAVERGEIDGRRYASFLKLREELERESGVERMRRQGLV